MFVNLTLRECNKCQMLTLQHPHFCSVGKDWADGSLKYYCTRCGCHWKEQKKKGDVKIK